jgi:mono/diheme cytochrome c family protein
VSRRRTRRAVVSLVALVLVGALGFVWATAPDPLASGALPQHAPNVENGRTLYHAASCLYCHRAPDGAGDASAGLPVGGAPFVTPVGTFYPGNLTPDPETGLGRWSEADFVAAMTRGMAPDGRHYFPAFPYASYAGMTVTDVLDLRAYLMSLPPVRQPARAAELPLEPLARRSVGLWKRIALPQHATASDPARSAAWNRGAYLVNAPGHCGECHTPRDVFMRLDGTRHLTGGPHPAEKGKVPSLVDLAARGRYKDAADLAAALQYGEEMGFDKLSSGGMGAIQSNLAKLPEAELAAIAEYLMSLREQEEP